MVLLIMVLLPSDEACNILVHAGVLDDSGLEMRELQHMSTQPVLLSDLFLNQGMRTVESVCSDRNDAEISLHLCGYT
jgi:hypothetical protein